MTRNPKARTIWVVALLSAVALGAAALTGLWHPNAPAEAFRAYLPQITLGTVLVAGIIDGINPCAFTVLLLFITVLTTTLQAGEHSAAQLRSRMLGLGSIYIASVFVTYLALGVGLLASVDFFTRQHIPARLGALAAVLFGLWMLKDYFLPELGWKLQGPARLGETTRAMARKATLPALIGGGVLIGLCTVPCSGAVYLAVLSLLALQPTALQGYAYLLLYNVVFVLPLAVILLAASSRPVRNRIAHWHLHHKARVKLALGTGVVVLGLGILATV
ncbi:MAG TPA: cytochrome c biogenesis protein CcdA [Ramlibacter sp.]|nr:cytochrome c biogenesis protein CcdA [Ramlibacter sp.]